MDENLYDEFGNYIGPDLNDGTDSSHSADDKSDGDEQENPLRQAMVNR